MLLIFVVVFSLSVWEVLLILVGFVVFYSILLVIEIVLMIKYVCIGLEDDELVNVIFLFFCVFMLGVLLVLVE